MQEFGNLVKMGCFSFLSPFSVAFARSDAALHKYNAARGDVASRVVGLANKKVNIWLLIPSPKP